MRINRRVATFIMLISCLLVVFYFFYSQNNRTINFIEKTDKLLTDKEKEIVRSLNTETLENVILSSSLHIEIETTKPLQSETVNSNTNINNSENTESKPEPKPVIVDTQRVSKIIDRGSFQHIIDEVPKKQILGIDISHYQSDRGEIEWSKVEKSKVEFAFIKISEGISYKDPYAKKHVEGARSVDIAVGGYHFARPSEPVNKDAMGEVAHFINSLKNATDDYGDLPAVLDLEDPIYKGTNGLSTESLLEWAKVFCEEFEKNTDHKIIIYTGNWFIESWNNFNSENNPLLDYELWVADYYSDRKPMGCWDSWLVWQFSDKGQIEGITGDVDLNIAYESLLTFCK